MIAVTGGIGSGKSAALAAFAAQGAAVLDTDAVVHSLLEREDVRQAVCRRLGLADLPPGADGRSLLADEVFSDPDKLASLQEVLFPLVEDRVRAWAGREAAAGAPALVVEVPMLFESGMEKLFDFILLIKAPEHLRKERYAGKAGADDFERRAARQMPDAEKEDRCHRVFENSGSLDDLKLFVRRCLDATVESGG
ncbi:dephospho-CoA kinase [bacterium BMS3Abin01]|nr:dephospho-CoA kinase [bacterium BMS3Abin01]